MLWMSSYLLEIISIVLLYFLLDTNTSKSDANLNQEGVIENEKNVHSTFPAKAPSSVLKAKPRYTPATENLSINTAIQSQHDLKEKAVAFGSPEYAEYNKSSPSISLTPLHPKVCLILTILRRLIVLFFWVH